MSSEIEDQWYWDRRNRKAYFPIHRGEGTVSLVTVWSADEIADATDNDVLVPLRGTRPDYVTRDDVGFDYFDSYRLPDDLIEKLRQAADESEE